jgi:hypothetical protein
MSLEGTVMMGGKSDVGKGITLPILALITGILGVAAFVGVGEIANNGVVGFVAISLPFALLVGFFSWMAPRALWFIAIAISTPVAIISCLSSWSGGYILIGAA